MTPTEELAQPDLSLRPGDVDDAPRLAEIHLTARAASPMPPAVHPPEEVREWLGERLRSDETWVAEVAGRPVGYARVTETWLDDLYVAPEAAGRGVGSALLELVQARRPRGFCLWVFTANTPARRFYAARGLVELEQTDGSANEERAPDVRMAWPGEDPVGFFRGLIDEVDEQLGDLLARRAALTRAVQPHKSSAARDPAREREIVERVAGRAPALGADRVDRIMRTIVDESLDAAR